MNELSHVAVVPARVTAPRAPETPAPFRFPLLATLAPVLASVIIWQVTGSAFALIFAAIGPLTAIASLVDSRFASRRSIRRELRRFDEDASKVAEHIRAHHAAESERRRLRFPSGSDLSAWHGGDPHRWSFGGSGAVLVNLGAGSSAGSITFEKASGASAQAGHVQARFLALERLTERIESGPMLADACLGIGITGSPVLSLAAVRSILLQLARSLSPGEFELTISAPAIEREWLDALPHIAKAVVDTDTVVAQFIRRSDRAVVATIATAATIAVLPSSCRVILRVDVCNATQGNAVQLVQHPDAQLCGPIEVSLVSRVQAAQWALRAREIAVRDGLVARSARLPGCIELSALVNTRVTEMHSGVTPASTERESRNSLASVFLVDEAGPVVLDLARDGPHAVVGGTTGSGKSELLISWVVSLAGAHSPESVTFLLVDFKGGAAFASLQALPHTVGIITDLDESEAVRALSSLRAELRFRERTLAASGARDICDLPALARLVIVVDEFATVIDQYPDLHALFSDIAARGRSLGVHLILCTQRPGVSVRDSVLANADLRLSLRVNNRSDSVAVVGSDAAARLDPGLRGRAIVSLAGDSPTEVHVAMTKPSDLQGVLDRWMGAPSPRRPWCEPLPRIVPLEELQAAIGAYGAQPISPTSNVERSGEGGQTILFGILDQPEHQARAVATFEPRRDGNLLIVGRAGSGKSTLLSVLGRHNGARPVATAADVAWDQISNLAQRLDRSGGNERADRVHELVLIDDLDSLLLRFTTDHRSEFVAKLSRILRDGAASGIAVAMAAQRLSTEVQPLAVLAGSTIALAPATRQDLSMLGLDPSHFVTGLPPGGGIWRGDRVQVLFVPARPNIEPIAVVAVIQHDRPLAIVSGQPALTAHYLADEVFSVVPINAADTDPRELVVSDGRGTVALLGDAEQWQSRWGALATLRPMTDVLFHRCSLADIRALTRSRELPPVMSDDPSLCWRWRDDGGFDRVRLG